VSSKIFLELETLIVVVVGKQQSCNKKIVPDE
jgi:hypothetical protein